MQKKKEKKMSNSNKRLYVDIHVIQAVPPSCINRDDNNRPKTSMFGGTLRAVVSSQAWKHAMRKDFPVVMKNYSNVGYRTQRAKNLVAGNIRKINPSISEEDAMDLAEKTLKSAVKNLEIEDDKTNILVFLSEEQAKAVAEVALQKDSKASDVKKALIENPSIDMILFGRMIAGDANKDLNIDASAQVAPAISTNTTIMEYDYFSAMDDLSGENGAAHLGAKYYDQGTLYRYANVNAAELIEKMGVEDAVAVIRGFVTAFINSMPEGSQNPYANRTQPNAVYITLRNDYTANLCGAYIKPVDEAKSDQITESIKALCEYAEEYYREGLISEPEKAYATSRITITGTEHAAVGDIISMLGDDIAKIAAAEKE